MNYIKEINAFYNKIEQEPLTSSGVSLWYALMHINNKAMWRESFTASGPVLRLKAGLTESSFKRARKELQEKDYITWKTRGRNLAPVYRTTSLASELGDHQDKGYPHESDFTYDKEATVTVSDTGASINTKENDAYVTNAAQPERTYKSDWEALSEYNEASPADTKARDSIFDPDAIRTQAASKVETNRWGHSDTPSSISETNASCPIHHTNHKSNHDTNSDPNNDTNFRPVQSVNHHMNHTSDSYVIQSSDHLLDHRAAPLVKQNQTRNETKQNETKRAAAAVFRFYEDNFGVASPFVKDSIVKWLEDLGEVLVLYAMEQALENGKETWAYTKGILQDWLNKGIRTIGDARIEELVFRSHKRHSDNRSNNLLSGEVVPDWLRELEVERVVVPAQNCVDIRDEKGVLHETQAMLDEFVGRN